MSQIKLLLKEKIESNGKIVASRITTKWLKNHCLYDNLINATSFLNSTAGLMERIYCVYNDINEIRKCLSCNKHATFICNNGIKKAYYQHFCSNKCRMNYPADKRKLLYNRKAHNKITNIPPKEYLNHLYNEKMMNFCEISEHLKKEGTSVSNQTVTKWIKDYQIPIRSVSKTISLISTKISDTKIEKYGYPYFSPDLEYTKSKGEIELKEFLNSHGFNFHSNRTLLGDNTEIDLYDSDKKIAIEYNGEIYHAEGIMNNRGRSYHYDKWRKCKDQGIQLITLYDTEWNQKKDKIKNFILSILGKYDRRIYARDCTVRPSNDKSLFDHSHIQGIPRNIKAIYGLFHNKELVGAVSYSRHHRLNDNKVVLSRLCFKQGIQVIGGASKLIKNSIKAEDYKELITWSDNRWSTGKLYENVGFKKDHEYGPDYSYWHSTHGHKTKQSLMKSKTNCPPQISEYEWNLQNGYYRIWDCGMIRWKYSQ